MTNQGNGVSSVPSLPLRLGISWLTNALVLAIVAAVLSGVHVSSAGSLLLAAAVFGVLNTVLKPLLRLVTLPLAILTFGIAWFFVSLLMLAVCAFPIAHAAGPAKSAKPAATRTEHDMLGDNRGELMQFHGGGTPFMVLGTRTGQDFFWGGAGVSLTMPASRRW